MQIDASAACIVLTGQNGAGKTNVLEAISLLAPGRGIRKAKIVELGNAKMPAMPWAVSALCQGLQGEVQIGTGLDINGQSEKRLIKIEGEKVRGQAELSRHLAVLWQTPQMDSVFIESGSARRKFLDRLVYNFDAEHASRVAAYEYAMRERNKLLQYHHPDPQWLSVQEQRMAERSVAIAAARNALIEKLNDCILQSETGFPKAHLHVVGEAEARLLQGDSAVDVETHLMEQFEQNRGRDASTGRTAIGAHRTELKVEHLMKNMEAAFCSTGEQKAMLLSILLAHARVRKEWQGAAPILLLDEVVAHLDLERRRELFSELEKLGAQAWLTGTDAADFSAIMQPAIRYRVSGGEISVF